MFTRSSINIYLFRSWINIHSVHEFFLELQILRFSKLAHTQVTHIHLNIFPDTRPRPNGNSDKRRYDYGFLHTTESSILLTPTKKKKKQFSTSGISWSPVQLLQHLQSRFLSAFLSLPLRMRLQTPQAIGVFAASPFPGLHT